MKARSTTSAPTGRGWTPALFTLLVVGTLLRLYYMGQPMRYDESVTYLYFAARPWATVVSSYRYPNNHVFHTLLVKACVTLLGDDPWVIRLPAFVAGIAMIPLTYSLGRRLVGPAVAHLGAALVAASGALALYSTNARGYTMICAATLILADVLLRLRERPSAKLWIACVVVMVLGTWTIPVMLFPAGGLVLWFALSALANDTNERRDDLRNLGLAVVAAGILTVLLYAPIIAHSGWAPLVRNEFVRSSPWGLFYRELGSSTGAILSGWTVGLPALVAVVFGVCAVIGLVRTRRTSGMRISMAGAMYVACAALLLITHRAPFPRIWLFLVAPTALIVARGILHLATRKAAVGEILATWPGALSIMAAMALGAGVILTRDVVMSNDTGGLYHAEEIATLLSRTLRAGDRVIAPLPSNAPLAYYFLRAGVDTSALSATPGDSSRVYLIVNTSEGFDLSMSLGDPVVQRYHKAQPFAKYPTAEVYQLQ
jgi:4-amino-4-deoxy-L-arabinose transferase-like glycosyltransferase